MELTVLGSSSIGNCYVLQNDNEALIIEAGVQWGKVRKAFGKAGIRKVAGAVVTHEHGDHAAYVRSMAAAGVTVLALDSVFRAHRLAGTPFAKAIQPGHGYNLGRFKVLALEVEHDVPCLAYVISHPDMGRLAFITDTVTFGYRLKGLNHIMIEANYADGIVDGNISRGLLHPSMRARLINSHMEIEETKSVLRQTDLSQVDSIVLIHLSDTNSDESRFVREVQELTGKPTYAADAGMVIDLSHEPY